MKKLVLAAAIAAMGMNTAQANETFVGKYIGGSFGFAGYDYAQDLANALVNNVDGLNYAIVEHPSTSFTFSINFGQWVTENLGYEIGYQNLGGPTVDIYTNLGSSSRDTSHQSVYASMLLGSVIHNDGLLYGKLGFHSSDSTFSVRGRSFSNDSTGILIGAGYKRKHTNEWSSKIEFMSFVDADSLVDDTITTVNLGIDYSF
jgi:opacity protein-like surface antigen